MPELPEVETVKRGLAPVMEGAVFARVDQRRADLRKPFPKGFAAALTDARVTKVDRRAKYLLVFTDQGHVLIWHLGMSGRVRIYPPGEVAPTPQKHDHVIFEMSTGAVIVFNDPRRFGLMDLCRRSELEQHPLLKDIGPEPLSNAFNGPALALALKGRQTAIKQALLEPRVVAGVGNIYASEALYRAGISPKRKAATVQGGRAEKLAYAIKNVLEAAIAAGGSTLKDHRTTDGGLGYFQFSFAVYGREREACPDCDCDIARSGGIRRLVQGGRSTFYCARRQR